MPRCPWFPRRLLLVLALAAGTPLLGAGREIGGILGETASPPLSGSSVVCNGTNFLVAWAVSSSTYRAIRIATVEADGRRSDPRTIGVSTSASPPRAVAVRQGYAVVWRDDRTIRVVFVALNGEVISQRELTDDAVDPLVAGSDDGLAIAFPHPGSGGDIRLVIFDFAGTVVTDRAIANSFRGVNDMLLTSRDVVLSLSSGLILRIPRDGGAVVATTVPAANRMAIARAGENVLVVWSTGDHGFASAIVLRDGQLTVNVPVASGFYLAERYAVARTADRFVLTFAAATDPKAQSATAVYAILLDGTGHPQGQPLALLEATDPNLAVAAMPGRALVTAGETAVLLDTTLALRALMAETVAVTTKPPQRDLSIVTNGMAFLAAFSEASAFHAVMPIRFDGEPLPPARAIGEAPPSTPSQSQSLACNGRLCMYALRGRHGIELRRLTPQGDVIDTAPIVMAPEQALGAVAVIAGGENFLAVWSDGRLRGAFVTPDGTVGPVRTFVDTPSIYNPRIAFDGTRFVITYSVLQFSGFPYTGPLAIHAVVVTRDGVAGTPLFLFPSSSLSTPTIPIASNGREFVVTASNSNMEVVAWALIADGMTLRVSWRTTIVRGFIAESSIAWNGAAYIVAWRELPPLDFRVIPANLFLGLTHLHSGGTFDPITMIPTGLMDTYAIDTPAIAVNDFGVELIGITEVREPGGPPRAVVYRSEEIGQRVDVPTAPAITSGRIDASGVTVTWKPGSNDQRGYIIRWRVGAGSTQTMAPAGATTASFPTANEPFVVEVIAWNEAGFSPASRIFIPGPHRVPGRR